MVLKSSSSASSTNNRYQIHLRYMFIKHRVVPSRNLR
eukprot:UN08730